MDCMDGTGLANIKFMNTVRISGNEAKDDIPSWMSKSNGTCENRR